MSKTIWCQKCGKDKPEQDVRQCSSCKMNCCFSCLTPATTIYAATRCHECQSRQNFLDYQDRNGRRRLTRNCMPGQKVWWETIIGTAYHGVLKEFDNGTAIVTMQDGSEKAAKAE